MAETFGVRSFLGAVSEIVRSIVPSDAIPLQERQSFAYVQFSFGDTRVHHEVWVQKRQRQVELGLHFEADAATNTRLLERLLEHEADLRRKLGTHIEFEQWTKSWTRLHETIAAPVLDLELAEFAAVRTAEYIAATRQLVDSQGPGAMSEWQVGARQPVTRRARPVRRAVTAPL